MSVTIEKSQRTDHMAYMEGMEQIDPTIRREVIEAREGYDAAAFGAGSPARYRTPAGTASSCARHSVKR